MRLLFLAAVLPAPPPLQQTSRRPADAALAKPLSPAKALKLPLCLPGGAPYRLAIWQQAHQMPQWQLHRLLLHRQQLPGLIEMPWQV